VAISSPTSLASLVLATGSCLVAHVALDRLPTGPGAEGPDLSSCCLGLEPAIWWRCLPFSEREAKEAGFPWGWQAVGAPPHHAQIEALLPFHLVSLT